MSGEGILSRLGARRRKPAISAAPTTPPPATKAAVVQPPQLVERRRQLAGEFAELQWDLGGIVYEMASRDHFRLDLLIRHSAKLQAVDVQLAHLDRILRLDEGGAAGSCTRCGALYARGAAFCWDCGNPLLQTANGNSPPQPGP